MSSSSKVKPPIGKLFYLSFYDEKLANQARKGADKLSFHVRAWCETLFRMEFIPAHAGSDRQTA